MRREDYAGDKVEVWPDNLASFMFFCRVGKSTRWRVSPGGGVIGLQFESIYPLMDRMGLEPEAWNSLLSDLEVMEHAALVVINHKDE